MTDHENRNAPAPLSPPGKIDNTENLLNDFGAAQKKAAASAAPSSQSNTAQDANTSPETPKADHGQAAGSTAATPTNKKAASSEAPKKTSSNASAAKKPATKKNTSADQAKVKNQSTKEKKPPESVHASTASSTSPKKEKPTKDAIDLEHNPRSSRPAHRVIPYVLAILAVFIGVSLLLNLFCNQGNQLENDPAAHWMGIVGYYVCYALFGLFGPAVFVLPLLLCNLAIFWKKFIDHRVTISKILVSTLFLLLLGAIIHVFCLMALDPAQRDITAEYLIIYGAQMTGGGLFGGALGYFLVQYLNVAGALVVGICLLAVSLFYFLGMTPQHLWSSYRTRHALRSERAPSLSRQDAEAARNKAAMDEKIRRVTSRQMTIDDEQETGGDDAVEVVKTAKKSPEDKLAPMPLPRLEPTDGSRPFVPRDVNRKLNEEARAQIAGAKPAPTAEKSVSPTTPATPAANTPEAQPKPVNPAQNRDAAVDPIFPKTNEARQVRRIPKEDRNFDLRNVFLDLDDSDKMQPRKHAPVPPEVPLAAAKRTAAATQAPVAPAAPQATAQPRPAVSGNAPAAAPRTTMNVGAQRIAVEQTPSSAKAPSLSAVKPAAPAEKTTSGEKPIFRQASNAGQKDYGLSNEEFEKMEATQVTLPKASVKAPVKPTEKATVGTKPTPDAKVPAKPTPAPKAEKPKRYVFPPISYLHPGEPMTAENRAEIEASMTQLAETLASFHVRVKEINYSCGPTVTRYEVILAAGVRVRTVTNLADDIALALRSSGGVRIEAPIPGTNAVGIEVPNKTRSTIYLRDLIESKAFTESKSKLAACLGADIAGQPLIFDIAKMPHLLIAGTTGSGKSVCINCIIMSLLYKVRPDEVKLVLIDPKKVEFSIYKNIPHLMAPVVTQPKDAAGALQAAVEEMERRFEVFENVGVRDLKGYNEVTKDDPDMPFIPHMVIIIDELADLMMTAKNEVETAICRIAQKARAAGMHLIIGTQRPSADVVTGLIKANVPSSIAFAVKSQVDSRVILDHGGAEALTGRGDMLFVPIGAMRDTRVQGAFVDDKEVEKICEFIRATNGTAQYDEKFISKLKELAAQCGSKGKSGGGDDALPAGSDEKGDDPKYADAVRVAIEEKRISTSLLQRKLEVGYSRAAKLIDRMQAEGIVSPPDGSKPRAILITPEEYLEKFVDNVGEQ